MIVMFSVVAIAFLLAAHEPSYDNHDDDDSDDDRPRVAEVALDGIHDVTVHHIAAVVPVRKKRGANALCVVLGTSVISTCLLGVGGLTVWTVLVVHFVDPGKYFRVLTSIEWHQN